MNVRDPRIASPLMIALLSLLALAFLISMALAVRASTSTAAPAPQSALVGASTHAFGVVDLGANVLPLTHTFVLTNTTSAPNNSPAPSTPSNSARVMRHVSSYTSSITSRPMHQAHREWTRRMASLLTSVTGDWCNRSTQRAKFPRAGKRRSRSVTGATKRSVTQCFTTPV